MKTLFISCALSLGSFIPCAVWLVCYSFLDGAYPYRHLAIVVSIAACGLAWRLAGDERVASGLAKTLVVVYSLYYAFYLLVSLAFPGD